MNIQLNSIPRTTLHKIRPYQSEAIREITDGTKEAIREQLHTDTLFSSAILIEMATGSGKTFTVGQYMQRMMNLIERHPHLRESMKHLRIILLSNRIDGVSQFRDDLTIGRGGSQPKPPILSHNILEKLKVSTYHSQADGEDLRSRSEQTEVLNILGEHELICVTDKTAKLHNIAEQISHVDLIIVDEAHNANFAGDLFDVLMSLKHKGRAGRSPLILALTATPSNITKELFGESRVTFNLPEYLASGYAPHVDYHIVANMSTNESQVRALELLIAQAQQEKHYREKKAILSEAANLFESMQLPGDTKEFVEDLIARAGVTNEAGIKQLEETVIFANSISEADEIARHLDPSGSGYALSYHSDNDANRAIDRLRDPQDPCKVIIAIGKLNESIDLPVVKNVVFYRNTSSAKIYLQQFGRGLRGDQMVHYYDYTASFKNFAWIGDIYQNYQHHKKRNRNEDNKTIGINNDLMTKGEREQTQNAHGFHITYGKIHGMEYGANLSRIGLTIGTFQKQLEALLMPTKEEIKEFLMKQYGSTEDLLKLTQKQIKIIEHPVGGKVKSLATLSGWENRGNLQLQTPSSFQAWVRWMYGLEALNKEEIKEFLMKQYGSTEDLLKLNRTQIGELEHPVGGKIARLITLSGWENRENLRPERSSGFQAWVRWMYGLEALNKEEIKEFLMKQYGSTEDLLKLNRTQIGELEHPVGGKIARLVKLSGWENRGNLRLDRPSGFQVWVRWMNDLEEVKALNKEDIKYFLTKQYGNTEDILKLNGTQIGELEHPVGGKIARLVKLSGWENRGNLQLQTPSAFQAWVRWIYGLEEVKILTKEEIQELVTKERIKEFLTTQYGCTEDILKLTKKQINAIKHPFGGKVTNLSKLSGWGNPGKLDVAIPSGFQTWVRWMYNENRNGPKKKD